MAESAESNPGPKAAKAKEQARASYLFERTKLLRQEIQALRSERRELAAKLKAATDRASAEARQLRHRRTYLSIRPTEATAELNATLAERQEIRARRAA